MRTLAHVWDMLTETDRVYLLALLNQHGYKHPVHMGTLPFVRMVDAYAVIQRNVKEYKEACGNSDRALDYRNTRLLNTLDPPEADVRALIAKVGQS